MEDQLRESEKRYRLLAENISDVIWVLDMDTARFRYVSSSVEHLRGYTPAEILAQDMAASLTPASFAHIRAVTPGRIEAFRRGESIDHIYDQVEQPRKDGSTVWTEVRARFVVDPDNGHLELYGVSRDISERKRIEDQVRQLSRAVEASPASIVITDTAGTIEYVNPKFTKLPATRSMKRAVKIRAS